MQKKFLTNLGILLFLNLLVKPFWIFGIDRSVQNAVGPEDFGFYFSILNFSFLFNIILDFGITNFNNRNIAQNHQLLNKHFSGILILKILLGVVYLAVSFIVGYFAGYDSKQFYILSWVVINQFLLSFILYLRSNISGLLLFKTDSVLSVTDRLLMIIFCGVLLLNHDTRENFKIEWFVYTQTAAYGLTALIAIGIVIRKAAFRKLNWNIPFLVMILRKSMPYALLVFLMAQYFRIDAVIIERLLPDDTGKLQAGIYAQAFRLLDAAIMISFLFSVLLLPIFSRMIKKNEPIEDLTKLSFSLLFTISIVAAIATLFYSTDIMQWLYPHHKDEALAAYQLRIDESSQIFKILMFGYISIASTYVFGTLLTANGSLKVLNIIAFSGVVVSLSVNFMLVPKMEAVGSAWASMSAQSITAIAQIILSFYIFKFRKDFRYFAALAIFVGGVYGLGYLSTLMGFAWQLNLVMMVFLSVILALSLRLLNIREVIKIIRTEKA
ncbi:MAG TPA: oligosaccharide flippase family protein [Bacteroidales bacterium]|nr:oligosaccharide flippase family protein [Bacteroidales bacterium]HPE55852.1 oligosaccharide flippase family protein [Bacteroidales bacterium]HRX96952.1 oligosaccharide flippase family protein [Bacteroidales bacterium]